MTRSPRRLVVCAVFVVCSVLVTSCAPEDPATDTDAPRPAANPVIELLEEGHPVFGIFSGDRTAEQGALMGQNREIDFVFYSLESGPFDLETMQTYLDAMRAAGPKPFILRIPPVRDGADSARARAGRALARGVDGIVFPHTEDAEQAAAAVAMMGDDHWPRNPEGRRWSILIIEDQVGVANARDIVATEGASVVFPGPGDLRRAYEGDMEAVEAAIQTVLAACVEFDVVCGITANADDIAERIEQGFRMFIVQGDDAVVAGLEAAGRR